MRLGPLILRTVSHASLLSPSTHPTTPTTQKKRRRVAKVCHKRYQWPLPMDSAWISTQWSSISSTFAKHADGT